MAGGDDDEDGIERLELVPDPRLDLKPSCWRGRISLFISERYESTRGHQMNGIAKPRSLYFVDGWPVISRNADKNDLVTHFGLSEEPDQTMA